jgi:hypothetical protein
MNRARACTVALCLLIPGLGIIPSGPSHAENTAKVPMELIAVGARYGTNAATDKAGAMDRVDIFWSWRSPFAWEFTPGWDIGARMNASVGALRGQGETGAVGTLVPTFAIGDTDNGFSVEAGAGAALFTKWEFGDVEDFGGPLQFILDLGVNFRAYKRLGLGYRFQHWSDAGMHGSDNRGVEMHMFEFSFRF